MRLKKGLAGSSTRRRHPAGEMLTVSRLGSKEGSETAARTSPVGTSMATPQAARGPMASASLACSGSESERVTSAPGTTSCSQIGSRPTMRPVALTSSSLMPLPAAQALFPGRLHPLLADHVAQAVAHHAAGGVQVRLPHLAHVADDVGEQLAVDVAAPGPGLDPHLRQLAAPLLDRGDLRHVGVGHQHQASRPPLRLLVQPLEGLRPRQVEPGDQAVEGRVRAGLAQAAPGHGDVGDVHVVGEHRAVAVEDAAAGGAHPEADLAVLQRLAAVVARAAAPSSRRGCPPGSGRRP